MKSFRNFFTELLFPPKCAVCGSFLQISVKDKTPALCRECSTAFRREMLSQCPECFSEVCNCRCMPRIMKKSGIRAFLKLSFYGTGEKRRAARTMILSEKDHISGRTVDFLAECLAVTVRQFIAAEKSALEPEKTVITFLPRSHRALRGAGFDQAEELSQCLSRKTGFAVKSLLKRRKDGRAQKNLSSAERIANMKNAFSVTEPCDGLRIFLLDDVVTTGAGMAKAAELLFAAGASEIISLAVARTE